MARSRVASWLVGLVLACWGSAAGLQASVEPAGIGQGAASSTREVQSPEPCVLARELPRIIASETSNRGQDGKGFAILAEALPQPPDSRRPSAPILSSDAPSSAPFRAFAPRGPPSRNA